MGTPTQLPALQRLIAKFDEALRAIGVEATPNQLERWSVLVHESMSGRGRRYHTVEHVFDISKGAAPIPTLAILFHDTVYCQADGGMRDLHSESLDVAVERQGDVWRLAELDDEGDPLRSLAARVFGFTPGDELSLFGGLNEFLSALLACRALGDTLPLGTLTQIVACIEATIPFRPADSNGVEALDRLYGRLMDVDRDFAVGLGEEQVAKTVGLAAEVGNRDVGNFSSPDPTEFLDNTWKLLPETNASLRGTRLYTVSEYRLAIQKMVGFFTVLDPKVVFQGFRGSPSEEELNRLDETAAKNIALGLLYLNAKLLASFMLEALAMHTGGDGPIALFMGDLPEEGRRTARLEDFLPDEPATADVDFQVLTLLSEGRTAASDFDLKTSPLAAYLYASLGATKTSEALAVAAGEDGLEQLLETLPKPIVRTIAKACAEIATTRVSGLHELFA